MLKFKVYRVLEHQVQLHSIKNKLFASYPRFESDYYSFDPSAEKITVSIDDRRQRGLSPSGPFPRHIVELERKQQKTEN